jgi:hypothetical protein
MGAYKKTKSSKHISIKSLMSFKQINTKKPKMCQTNFLALKHKQKCIHVTWEQKMKFYFSLMIK